MNKEQCTIKGKIRNKFPNASDNPKAPSGDFYIEGDSVKFTVWKQDMFDKIEKGRQFEIDYEESENEYNGKTYINRNILSIKDIGIVFAEENMQFSDMEIEALEKEGVDVSKLKRGESNSGMIILGRKVEIEEVDVLKLPKEVYNYLLTRMNKDGESC